eukprot:634961-Prymnesium_polylepis.1
MMLLVQDRFFFTHPENPRLESDGRYSVTGWDCKAFDPCSTTIIPYPSAHFLDRSAPPPEFDRTTLIFFRGNTQLDTCQQGKWPRGFPLPPHCWVRGELIGNATDSCPSMDLNMAAIDKTRDESSTHSTYSDDFSVASGVQGMRNSTFCLVPRGDSPTSRRLYDAIQAGCIPVVVASKLQLPFESELDWRQFALFYSDEEARQDPCVLFDTLRNVSPARVMELRTNLWRVRHHFSYVYASSDSTAFLPGGAIISALSEVAAAVDGGIPCSHCDAVAAEAPAAAVFAASTAPAVLSAPATDATRLAPAAPSSSGINTALFASSTIALPDVAANRRHLRTIKLKEHSSTKSHLVGEFGSCTEVPQAKADLFQWVRTRHASS